MACLLLQEMSRGGRRPTVKKKNRQDMLDRIMQEKQLIQQLASSKVLSAVC